MCDLLIRAGANVRAEDRWGNTPLGELTVLVLACSNAVSLRCWNSAHGIDGVQVMRCVAWVVPVTTPSRSDTTCIHPFLLFLPYVDRSRSLHVSCRVRAWQGLFAPFAPPASKKHPLSKLAAFLGFWVSSNLLVDSVFLPAWLTMAVAPFGVQEIIMIILFGILARYDTNTAEGTHQSQLALQLVLPI
jgi:hypothetical protein